MEFRYALKAKLHETVKKKKNYILRIEISENEFPIVLLFSK